MTGLIGPGDCYINSDLRPKLMKSAPLTKNAGICNRDSINI